jgi:hypothetical protein
MRRTYKRKKGGNRNRNNSKQNNSKQNKICIIMSDNREISDDYENAEYHSLAVAINYNYAKKHGYNFIYYNPYIPNEHKITNSNSSNNMKNKIDSFQSKLNKYRYASWTKLVTLFNTLLENYKYVFYLDTDAIIINNIDLEKYLREVPYFKGNKDSELKFLINKPHTLEDPCAGVIIIRNSDITKRAVKYWWNYDMPKFDKKHAYEQESLWSFVNNKDSNIEPYVGIIDELSFEPKEGQYVRHVGSSDNERRVPIFKCWYETLYNKEEFKNTIDEIKKNNVKKVDIIKLEQILQNSII